MRVEGKNDMPNWISSDRDIEASEWMGRLCFWLGHWMVPLGNQSRSIEWRTWWVDTRGGKLPECIFFDVRPSQDSIWKLGHVRTTGRVTHIPCRYEKVSPVSDLTGVWFLVEGWEEEDRMSFHIIRCSPCSQNKNMSRKEHAQCRASWAAACTASVHQHKWTMRHTTHDMSHK